MKVSGNPRRKTALLLSSTVGLALTLAGCTSVEVASKGDAIEPKIASAAPAATTAATPGTEVAAAANTQQQQGTPAVATTAAPVEVAANGVTAAMPTTEVLKGGRVALPPAAEIAAAAAAIDAQIAPTVPGTQAAPTQQVALAATAAPTPATSAVIHQSNTSALPQVVALKGAFPPAPGAPGTPSAAAVPLTEEMMKQQSVIPMPKPQAGTMLAYASAPQNAALAAISTREGLTPAPDAPSMAGREKLSGLISKYATMYNVPEDLVHRVVMRESRYNPNAINRGHFGLMQIKHATARSMGFNGPASGLFDAETNLKYAVKYLSGAWMVADNDRDNAVRLYARGYYYDAKRKGMLHVLRK